MLTCGLRLTVLEGAGSTAERIATAMPAQNPPHRHHYIPRMILRNFLNQEGGLWFWRRQFQIGEVRAAKPESLFVEDNLYTSVLDDGERDAWLEHQLANVDFNYARLIAQILPVVRAGQFPLFDAFTWDALQVFEYIMGKRSSAWHDRFVPAEEVIALVTAMSYEPEFTEADRAALVNMADRDRVMKNARIAAQATPPPDDLMRTMRLRGIAFLVAPPGASFVIGDYPTALATVIGRTSLGVDRGVIFMPIAGDVALAYVMRSPRVYVEQLSKAQVRVLNEAMTRQSVMIAGQSKPLIRSLSRMNYEEPEKFTTEQYLSERRKSSG